MAHAILQIVDKLAKGTPFMVKYYYELLPVKRTVKKYKFSLVYSHCSVGLFYAAIYIVFFYWCQNAKAALNTFIVVVLSMQWATRDML